VRELALRSHLVAEPSGAVAPAAYLAARPAGRTVVICSGGNVEADLLTAILTG
jgi:threo-3-hydroxy-L-aspartate ammonia-lyase